MLLKMSQHQPFIISQMDGMTPLVSHVFKMMGYTRAHTIRSIQNLSIAQLDHLHDEKSNSIGALLKHIAAVEMAYQVETFENNRELTQEEIAEWGDALDLGEAAQKSIRGNPAEYYIDLLKKVRQRTTEEFKKRDDTWLMQEKPFWDGLPANHYFIWFHVFEDEINHRGQINWLKKRLPKIA
jgi:uncharacterized damage-inducible protein DinB